MNVCYAKNDTVIEKMTFECNKSFGATTNLRQQNPCVRNGIIFVAIS